MAANFDDIATQGVGNVSSIPSTDPEYDYPKLQILNNILVNYAWILPVVFGFPGNLLSIMVASRKHNRKLSPCVYMIAMAAADTTLLAVVGWFFPLFFSEVGKTYIHPRDFFYKFSVYLTFTCGMQSGYFLSAMSIDRLIAVRYPMMTSSICTTTRAKKIVLITLVLAAAININMFYTYKYFYDPDAGVEVLLIVAPGDNRDLDFLVSGLQLILGTLIPFLIILISNIMMIATIKRASRERKKLENTSRDRRESRNLTRMVILVSTAYIVTSLPYRMLALVLDFPGMAEIETFYDKLKFSILAWFMFDYWCWNFSINFYLYCLAGGRRYREDTREVLRELITLCARRK